MTVPAGELPPIRLLRRQAVRGSVNIHKTSVKARSFPPYTLEKVMATLSAWKFSSLQGADEVLAQLEKPSQHFAINLHDEAVVSGEIGRKKPKTVIPPGWRFCEGACEHELRG